VEPERRVPRLETERLLLREWLGTDRAPYGALCADPEVMRHFPSTMRPEDAAAQVDGFIAGWSQRGFGLWAVQRADTGEFIGFTGLSSPRFTTDFTPCVEVGWRLARQHWGNGFAPEAARAAIDWGFAHLDLPNDEVVSFTTVANANSRRVMEKIGMVEDPDRAFDHPLYPEWSGARHVLYATTRQHWKN
jgi:RimJ/RimL family protein N-acetyltransferase